MAGYIQPPETKSSDNPEIAALRALPTAHPEISPLLTQRQFKVTQSDWGF
jgi:hypothetical protein